MLDDLLESVHVILYVLKKHDVRRTCHMMYSRKLTNVCFLEKKNCIKLLVAPYVLPLNPHHPWEMVGRWFSFWDGLLSAVYGGRMILREKYPVGNDHISPTSRHFLSRWYSSSRLVGDVIVSWRVSFYTRQNLVKNIRTQHPAGFWEEASKWTNKPCFFVEKYLCQKKLWFCYSES